MEGVATFAVSGRRARAIAAARVRRGAARAPLSPPAATAVAACILVLEVVGTVSLWSAVPLGWMRVGGWIYNATGSLAAYGAAALLGYAITACYVIRGLAWADVRWVGLRRQAGRDQREGALTRVVVVSTALGLVSFLAWYYLLSHAFIMPFMPSR